MEQAGITSAIITQNVDGLHRKAGSQRVVELHGNISRVVCLSCGQRFSRTRFDENFLGLNPWITDTFRQRAASTAESELYTPDVLAKVAVPSCSVCSGTLKPDVVFFGEFVPAAIFAASTEAIKQSNALIVAGSSLAVNSAVRLVELARKRKMPIVIINRGETASDRWATCRIDASCSETLLSLARRLGSSEINQDIE
jgi:NAD-dependent SIR2 family protein deacetylase